jgi:hypothetical protein
MDPYAPTENCPICDIPFTPKFGRTEEERTAHVNACIESQIQLEASKERNSPGDGKSKATPVALTWNAPPNYSLTAAGSSSHPAHVPPSTSSQRPLIQLFAGHRAMLAAARVEKKAHDFPGGGTIQHENDREWRNFYSFDGANEHTDSLRHWFSSLGNKSMKVEDHIARADAAMWRRWGPAEEETYQIAMRYIVATRMTQHWEGLALNSPGEFEKHLGEGYMEPIPVAWVQDRRLASQNPEGSRWETPAEKRLYYLLNNGVLPDGQKHAPMRPLNIVRDRNTIIRRGNERNARQVHIDAQKLAAYQSRGDVFHSDKQIQSHNYSAQVPNTITPSRQRALHELADGIQHGTDHLETMLLIDVSGSMTWNPHDGLVGTTFSSSNSTLL